MTRLRHLAILITAFASAGAASASAATSRSDSTAAPSPAVAAAPATRHADGSLSVHPGERFTEYLVAGRDSTGRLRMRCVQGTDRAQRLLMNRALWLRPRATK